MFTDQPVTPTRVETLVDLLRQTRYQFDREKLGMVLQPDELPKVGADSRRTQTSVAVRAAVELGLVEETARGLRLTFERGDPRPTRDVVLQAVDERVLSGEDVEPYFARFYAWLLNEGRAADTRRNGDEWAKAFETAVYQGRSPNNPFNGAKYDGLKRWIAYAGLGWFDPRGVFQPNPFGRVSRRLDAIFGGDDALPGDEFMARVGECCPELDGGAVFVRALPAWRREATTCTLGLSHALVDLHLARQLRLTCARDSGGWSIAAAAPPVEGTMQSARIDFVARAQG